MQTKHYAILAGLLVALGLQLAGVEHGWRDVVTPMFLGGVLTQIGTTLIAIFTEKPS